MERDAGQLIAVALTGMVLAGQATSPSVLAGSRFAMRQKSRVRKPRKPTLAHMVSDLMRLLKAMEGLERLREKVRLAENDQRPR